MEFKKLRVTEYWGPLVKPVKEREGILFTWFQGNIWLSQNIFITPVDFTLTPDEMHGSRGTVTVPLEGSM